MNIRKKADTEARLLYFFSLAPIAAQITMIIGAFIAFFAILHFAGIF